MKLEIVWWTDFQGQETSASPRSIFTWKRFNKRLHEIMNVLLFTEIAEPAWSKSTMDPSNAESMINQALFASIMSFTDDEHIRAESDYIRAVYEVIIMRKNQA